MGTGPEVVLPVEKARFVTGARGDIFSNQGTQHVNTAQGDLNGQLTRARPHVKANLVLGPWAETEWFANFGTGYHSNHARVVLADRKLDALPTARGYEFGVRSRLVPRVDLFATYRFLDLGQRARVQRG